PPVEHHGSSPLQSLLANRSIPGLVPVDRAQIALIVGTDIARGLRAYFCSNLGGTLSALRRLVRTGDALPGVMILFSSSQSIARRREPHGILRPRAAVLTPGQDAEKARLRSDPRGRGSPLPEPVTH